MALKQFKKGDVIFREGSFGSTMYEIKSGCVEIYAAYGTPDEKKLTDLEAGRIFGEMAVIEVYPRSATAVAQSDTEAEEISTADLQTYFNEKPEKLLEIMQSLSRRVRELTADYTEVCESISQWKDDDEQGRNKSDGLMGKLRRFAEIFAESAQYMTTPGAGLYY